MTEQRAVVSWLGDARLVLPSHAGIAIRSRAITDPDAKPNGDNVRSSTGEPVAIVSDFRGDWPQRIHFVGPDKPIASTAFVRRASNNPREPPLG